MLLLIFHGFMSCAWVEDGFIFLPDKEKETEIEKEAGSEKEMETG